MEKVRTAVVGVGTFGQVHARTYHESETAELVWVCDLNADRAREVAAEYGCKYTTDSREIADDDSVQVVSVATPDFAHLEPCLQMIHAGKHLLVEKPLATTLEDAEAITRAAQEKGVRLMTDFQNRWNPPFAHAKQLLDTGELGYPVSAYIRLCGNIGIVDRIPWSARSGPQWFLGPHIVDLVRWLVGQNPVRVFASGRREILSKKGVDIYDALQAQIIFEDCYATVETAWIIPPTWPSLDFRMDLLTSAGKIEIEPIGDTIAVAGSRYSTPFITGRGEAFGKMLGFFREPILHFIDCVRNNIPCIVQPDDGLVVTRTIVAIEKSIETGQIVDI